MTDEKDICGHPTQGGDGPPCQHPASEGDSCWIDAHGGSTSVGRPTTFTDELAREAIEAAPERYSYAGIERAIGVGNGTINDEGGWLDQDLTFTDADGNERDFSAALERARGEGEHKLIQGGLYDDDMDTSMAKFLLATSLGHTKTEEREHSTPEGQGPLMQIITEDGDD